MKQMMKTLKLLGALSLWGLQADALALAEIEIVTVSEACGDIDHQVVAVGESKKDRRKKISSWDESLEIYYNDFALLHDRFGDKALDCEIEVKVKIPPRTRFRASSASAEGTYSLAEGSSGSVDLSYTLSATGAIGAGSGTYAGVGDFQIFAPIDRQEWTRCSDSEQWVTLSSRLGFSINNAKVDVSEFFLDEVDQGPGLSWNWGWESCWTNKAREDSIKKSSWEVSYKMWGKTMKGYLELDKRKGAYKIKGYSGGNWGGSSWAKMHGWGGSSRGSQYISGDLRNIRYMAVGNKVKVMATAKSDSITLTVDDSLESFTGTMRSKWGSIKLRGKRKDKGGRGGW